MTHWHLFHWAQHTISSVQHLVSRIVLLLDPCFSHQLFPALASPWRAVCSSSLLSIVLFLVHCFSESWCLLSSTLFLPIMLFPTPCFSTSCCFRPLFLPSAVYRPGFSLPCSLQLLVSLPRAVSSPLFLRIMVFPAPCFSAPCCLQFRASPRGSVPSP